MPLDPVSQSLLISGGISAATQGANMYAAGKTNRKTREWNEKMYEKQKIDTRANWDAQNAYNHPAQQMQRLKEAGLNPNLVYGKGADAMGGSIDNPSMPNRTEQTPQMSNPISASDILAAKSFNQNISNMKEQNRLIQAQTLKTISEAAKTDQEREQAAALFNTVVEQAIADVELTKSSTDINVQNLDLNQLRYQMDKKSQDLQNKLTQAQTAKTKEEKTKISAEIKNLGQTYETMLLAYKGEELKQAQTKQETERIKKDIERLTAQIKNLNANTDATKQDTEWARADRNFDKATRLLQIGAGVYMSRGRR